MKSSKSKLYLFTKSIVKHILPHSLRESIKRNILFRPIKKKVINAQSVDKNLARGINIIGIIRSGKSIGLQTRLIAKALDKVNIPYCMIDLCEYMDIEKCNFDYEEKITNELIYNVNLIVLNADCINRALYALNYNELFKRYNIGYWAWELSEFPDIWKESFNSLNEIWANSHFSADAIKKKSPVPVMPLPLYADSPVMNLKNGRDYFKIKNNIFLFMAAYDCESFISRKNPQAAVRAFIKAFSPEDRNIGLVLKLFCAENYQEHVKELFNLLSGYPNIYYFNKYFSEEEMRTLTGISDAFITLHRSEGLGLIPMEAMALGTPVISTAYSGNMEYMTHKNSVLVDYNLIPVNGQYLGTKAKKNFIWAEPDIEDAANKMKRLVADNKWREELIKNGKETIENYFNADTMGNSIYKRLDILGLLN